MVSYYNLPSGKRLRNYGKSQFFMGQSTIDGPYSIAFCMFTRGYYSKYIHQLTINSPRKSFPSPGLEVRLPLLQGQHLLAWRRAILATTPKKTWQVKKNGETHENPT